MPVSPDHAATLARATVEQYQAAERRLIERIARLVARGVKSPDVLGQLDAVRSLRAQAQRIVDALEEASARAVGDALGKAARIGEESAVADLAAAGQPAASAGRLPGAAALDRLVADTVATVQASHARILPWAVGVLRDVIAAVSGQVLLGVDTRVEAAQRALDRLVERGVTGYVDRAGRGWDLGSYVEMAVRTSTGRAAVDSHVSRLADGGMDLVIVSDSPRECPLCRPYEGKVLSASGGGAGRVAAVNPATGETVTVDVYAGLDEARRNGLFHPNCRHSVSAYMPGLTTPRGEAEPAGYERQQRQRAIERHIREWKRREAAALTPAAQRRARAKVRAWQEAMRRHLGEHPELKRQPRREQIGRAR